MPPPRPLYIVLEGTRGAGKSTQTQLLQQFYQSQGWPAVVVKEPGGSPYFGQKIRDLLMDLEPNKPPLTPHAEALLFMADRAQLQHAVVLPALASGTTVIGDRCFLSSLAYQGGPLGLRELVELLIPHAAPRMPDLIAILDLPVEDGLARNVHRQDRYTREVEYYQRVRQGYLAYAQAHSNCVVLPGERDPQVLFEQFIKPQILNLLAGVPDQSKH